jgi:hypothetical protein
MPTTAAGRSVRDHRARALPRARRAGARVGAVIMCTLLGMALGGWMSGRIFDLTGSYRAAFVNGLAWNAANLSIALFLLRGTPRGTAFSFGLASSRAITAWRCP